MSDTALRDAISKMGSSLFARGLTFGSTGNISVRVQTPDLVDPLKDFDESDLDPDIGQGHRESLTNPIVLRGRDPSPVVAQSTFEGQSVH